MSASATSDVPSVPVEPADPGGPRRVLLVAAPSLRNVAPLVGWVRHQLRPEDTLVVRAGGVDHLGQAAETVPGAERYSVRVAVSLGIRVERVADPVAELGAVWCWLAGVPHDAPDAKGWTSRPVDDVPERLVHAAALAGVPGVLHVEGAYPFDPASREHQRRWSEHFRERAREAAADARAAAQEEARAAARPRRRPAAASGADSGRPVRSIDEARRAAFERRTAAEREAS